jgi:L-malate glycosyltransferase
MKQPLTIFIPHCSDLLTDHLPHGDGLIAHGFISHLARRGHRVHVAAQRVDLKQALGPNVTIHQISEHSSGEILWRAGYMRSLRRLFWELKKTVRFDLIHQLNPVFTGLSLPLTGSGLPLVLGTYVARWPADSDGPEETRANRAVAYVRDVISAVQQYQADALVLTTPAARNRLPNVERIRDRLHFLPHGIDTELFSPAAWQPPDPIWQLGYPSILYFANVVKRKGIFTLIEAFSLLSHRLPNAWLRVVGDGPDLPEAKRLADRLNCTHRVEFLGRQERSSAPEFYRNCSVYCLPSFGEPYAGTLLEAMSCGKPIVATDTGGTPHLVREQGGILVQAGDAGALAGALCDLLRDRPRREAMGRHNRDLVERTMSWDRVMEQLDAIYEMTIQAYRSRRRNKPQTVYYPLDQGSEAPLKQRF